jgi:threonine/homoserine/homoserine lactone efflux protein
VAWSTSRTPGTGGFHARSASTPGGIPVGAEAPVKAVISSAGSYKTVDRVPHSVDVNVNCVLPLVGFSLVSSVTPGPNNILLWASGAQFGFVRTLPHVLGTAVGLAAMALAVAAGLGVIITSVPQIAIGMKVAGSLYLLYLAYQIAGADALRRGVIVRPLGVLQAAAFQVINPKAWIFALGAITTFRPADVPILVGGAFVALTMLIVIVPSASLWAGGGDALSRLVEGDRARRLVSFVLAAVVVATVGSVWI